MLVVTNGAFKSGSTWLHRIAHRLIDPRPIPKRFKNPRFKAQSVDPASFEQFLEETDIETVDYLSKNHVRDAASRTTLLSNEHVRVLNITRDIRDVLVSAYYHDRREGRLDGEISDYWADLGKRRIAQVIEHHRVWNTGHVQVFVTSYEALHSSFEAQVQALADFLGVEEIDMEGIKEGTNFRRLHDAEQGPQPFYRKGIVGDWRNHLTPEIVEELAYLATSAKDRIAEARAAAVPEVR